MNGMNGSECSSGSEIARRQRPGATYSRCLLSEIQSRGGFSSRGQLRQRSPSGESRRHEKTQTQCNRHLVTWDAQFVQIAPERVLLVSNGGLGDELGAVRWGSGDGSGARRTFRRGIFRGGRSGSLRRSRRSTTDCGAMAWDSTGQAIRRRRQSRCQVGQSNSGLRPRRGRETEMHACHAIRNIKYELTEAAGHCGSKTIEYSSSGLLVCVGVVKVEFFGRRLTGPTQVEVEVNGKLQSMVLPPIGDAHTRGSNYVRWQCWP